ncbi:MAG TPA: S9 family peptidase [Thermoanaerobaculia bacterium]|nr:S9 family peptidase [Thermoanaerobaculia bacterium]
MVRKVFFLAFIACASALFAATTPTIDQLLSLKSVSRARISPDGRAVVYEVTDTDWNDNAYVSQLWLADVQSGRRIQLTRGKKSAESAEWSPDGKWIAFLTEREMPSIDKKDKKEEAKPDARQIWILSPSGGEAWPVTKHGAKIDSFAWSRDGKRIAFSAPVPESKAHKDRKEKYSDFVVFEGDYDQNQLWVVDVKDGVTAEATQVTSDPKRDVTGFDWSPDGNAIAFSAAADPFLADRGTSDIYLVDLAHGNAVRPLVTSKGPDGNPHFSPDGRSVAFTTALDQPYFFYQNNHVATVDVASGKIDDLSSAFDEDASLVDWGPEGIYFTALQKTNSDLFRLDPKTRAIVRLTPADAFVSGVSISPDFKSMAWTAASPTAMTEVFTGTFASPRKLTDMNAQLSPFTLGTVEMVSWTSKDGTPIEGVLHKPANYDASKKYPLLVVIHGGPTGISRPLMNPGNRYYPIELFLARGALVLEPNYRGSAGYGEKFRSLNVRNLGVGDMWDVMSGVDSLIAKGIVDPTRLGSMGWSQGGYISAFLTTNTDRFKAISVGAGISDWTTYYVNTDITPFTRQYLHATPWDDPEIYAKTSPITNIRHAKTPTLIQHGDADKRVPPPNSMELYRGLRDEGVPAKLIFYNGFGHPITKPKSNRAVLQHNLDWFDYYIFGDPIPADSPLRGSGSGE